MHISHPSDAIITVWSRTAEADHIPFPDTHVATLESANGKAPNNISTQPRRARHDSIVINGDRTGPASLALLVLLLGVILELYSTRTKVTYGMVRRRPGVTRTPEHRRCISLAVCMSGGGSGVCRCLHECSRVRGWVVKMQGDLLLRHLLLLRAVRRWSRALLLLLLLRWRQRLPHRLFSAASKGPCGQGRGFR